MNHTARVLLLACLVLPTAFPGVCADESKPVVEKKRSASIAYAPPMRGAPLSRIGGGTRSIKAADLVLEALAPEHTGLTLSARPVLYWYCSRAIEAPVEFALVQPNVAEPVLEVALPGPFAPGIHAVDLASHGVELREETEYEWYVSVVFDAAQRSSDVTAGAGIRRLAASDPVRAALAASGTDAVALAGAGVWYDAITALSRAAVTDATARARRAELLGQVGLGSASAR